MPRRHFTISAGRGRPAPQVTLECPVCERTTTYHGLPRAADASAWVCKRRHRPTRRRVVGR